MTNTARIGTEVAVPIAEVGWLMWSEEYSSMSGELPEKFEDGNFTEWSDRLHQAIADGTLNVETTYSKPRPAGFRLTLMLDIPFCTVGSEDFTICTNLLQTETSHVSRNAARQPEASHFPKWLIDGMIDLQDWTEAGNVSCYDNPEVYEGEDSFSLNIKVGFGEVNWVEYPLICNADMFIGNFAFHLARLAIRTT